MPKETPTPRDRAEANGHFGAILWMTGLSGAGKSTLAAGLVRKLFSNGCQAVHLDGDEVRKGLSADLGFSSADRAENIRRAGEVAALMARSGTIVVAAFISPYRADRERLRRSHPDLFHEIYVNAPVEVCEARDVKGLYGKARAGLVRDFTGVSAPYEPPPAPEMELRTDRLDVERCVQRLADYVERRLRLAL